MMLVIIWPYQFYCRGYLGNFENIFAKLNISWFLPMWVLIKLSRGVNVAIISGNMTGMLVIICLNVLSLFVLSANPCEVSSSLDKTK